MSSWDDQRDQLMALSRNKQAIMQQQADATTKQAESGRIRDQAYADDVAQRQRLQGMADDAAMSRASLGADVQKYGYDTNYNIAQMNEAGQMARAGLTDQRERERMYLPEYREGRRGTDENYQPVYGTYNVRTGLWSDTGNPGGGTGAQAPTPVSTADTTPASQSGGSRFSSFSDEQLMAMRDRLQGTGASLPSSAQAPTAPASTGGSTPAGQTRSLIPGQPALSQTPAETLWDRGNQKFEEDYARTGKNPGRIDYANGDFISVRPEDNQGKPSGGSLIVVSKKPSTPAAPALAAPVQQSPSLPVQAPAPSPAPSRTSLTDNLAPAHAVTGLNALSSIARPVEALQAPEEPSASTTRNLDSGASAGANPVVSKATTTPTQPTTSPETPAVLTTPAPVQQPQTFDYSPRPYSQFAYKTLPDYLGSLPSVYDQTKAARSQSLIDLGGYLTDRLSASQKKQSDYLTKYGF